MVKMLGQAMLIKQETAHLILSLAMILCSHIFALINLDDNPNLIIMPNTINESTNGVTGKTTTENNTRGNNKSGNNLEVSTVASTGVRSTTDAKKTIVEMCGLRMDKNHWSNDGLHNHRESGL